MDDEYSQIEEIKRFLFIPMVFVIKHRSPDIGVNVMVNGWGLGRKIKDLNEQHGLELTIRY